MKFLFVATVSKLQLQVLLEKLNKETNEYKKNPLQEPGILMFPPDLFQQKKQTGCHSSTKAVCCE